ncbi:MAG: o-succinylbenzoate synthase [bacterium]|nr:o-succinylbenzoate synthase [bacterium]
MRIDQIELREIDLRLKFRFETSFGVEQDRRVLLVTVRGEGGEGVAECVAGEFPGYSYETNETAWSVIRDSIAPVLLGRDFATPAQLLHALRLVRGHNMAVAAVEMAFWDLWARSLDLSLWQLLGGVRTEVSVGVSLGIQSSPQATAELAVAHVAEGYKRVKLKIKPGWDVEVVRAVREALPDVDLTVDANSAYRLVDAATLRRLDDFDLAYIEQPLAYDDLVDHAELQRQLRTAICLDESIHSAEDARKGLQIGAGRIINVKVGRVRGYTQAKRLHDVAVAFGAPVWCGGMLESGVGRAHNLHLSSLEGFVLPGDTASASRYWDEDLVEPLLDAVDGVQQVPQGPGIGVTLKRDLVARLTRKAETFRPS